MPTDNYSILPEVVQQHVHKEVVKNDYDKEVIEGDVGKEVSGADCDVEVIEGDVGKEVSGAESKEIVRSEAYGLPFLQSHSSEESVQSNRKGNGWWSSKVFRLVSTATVVLLILGISLGAGLGIGLKPTQ